MPKKYSLKEVQDYIESFNYRILFNEYIDNNHPLLIQCDKYHIYETTFRNFKSGKRCRICSYNNMKYLFDEVKIYIEQFGYKLISKEYHHCNDLLEIECNKGHKFKMSFTYFKRGCRCSECFFYSLKKSEDYIKNYIENYGYHLLSNYVNAQENLKLQCDKGHIYEANWNTFQQGKRCPNCAGEKVGAKIRKSIDEIQKQFNNKGYVLLNGNEYKDNNSKLNFICPNGHVGKTSWRIFRRGFICSECHESFGELKIKEYLILNTYLFDRQYKFKDCKNKRSLPFDFAVFNDKKELQCLIEYDGKQHFKSVSYFGGEDNLIYVQNNDQIKSQYCIQKNIPLLRIPYWDFKNIESILDSYFLMLKNNQINSKQLQNEKVG